MGLPPISLNGNEWIETVRVNLVKLISDLGITGVNHLNQKIRKKGLNERQLRIPLLENQPLFPSIRQETIHHVKGESIDGVLVLGSVKFWNAVMRSVEENKSSEDRRLAYVAMTRARHLLVVGLPETIYNKYFNEFVDWGFKVYEG